MAVSTAFMMSGRARRVRPILDWMERHGDALEAWRSRRRGAARADPAGRLAAVPPDRRARVDLRDDHGRPRPVQRLHHLRRARRWRSPTPRSSTSSPTSSSCGRSWRTSSASCPPDFTGAPLGVPLRWKLLGALPLINVITGVVVSGLSTDGTAQLEDLGLDVVVAVLVAFTISLELTRARHALGAPAGGRAARGDRGGEARATSTRACRSPRATSWASSRAASTR